MKLEDAKGEFIHSWGVLGTQWGISRTMAQIHALLLVTPDAIHAEDIMEGLQISRGNVNMNLRELMNWGLVEKILKPGERREFFLAEKDIWKVSMRIIRERRKRELDPMLKVLEGLKEIDRDPKDADVKAFSSIVTQIQKNAKQADSVIEGLIKADENWFTGTLLKMFK